MVPTYFKIRLTDNTIISGPAPLPYDIENWTADFVVNLTGKVPARSTLDGTGFWPVSVSTPAHDPSAQTPDGTTAWTVDAINHRVLGVLGLRPLNADELAALLASSKTAKRAAVDVKRDAILFGGFSYDFSGTIGVKTLQTRVEDETNWLTLQASSLAAVSAGQGAVSGVVIRTLDNVNVPLTYSAALQTMLAMAAWGSTVYARSWVLKDAIEAAADRAALDAIDITAGWPAPH